MKASKRNEQIVKNEKKTMGLLKRIEIFWKMVKSRFFKVRNSYGNLKNI